MDGFDVTSPDYIHHAREDLINRQAEAMWRADVAEKAAGLGLALHLAARTAIRTARVACGAALFALAWWAASVALDVFATPFATLAILSIIGAVFMACISWTLLMTALKAAFGAAPTTEQRRAAIRVQVANSVYERERAAPRQ